MPSSMVPEGLVLFRIAEVGAINNYDVPILAKFWEVHDEGFQECFLFLWELVPNDPELIFQ